MIDSSPRRIKVFLLCTGVGIMNRGIESFFRECFDGLHGMPGVQIELHKGGGSDAADERRFWCLPRTGRAASVIGRGIRRNGYVVEQLSAVLPVIQRIRAGRPDVIFYSDGNLAMRLWKYRRQIGVPFRMLFSNGAPLPPPFDGTDHVQQVTPFYMQMAIDAGESPAKHSLVPYGIKVPPGEPMVAPQEKASIRQKLGLPLDRKIVLSVGWISAYHKRMDYVVQEVAKLAEPRPLLIMLGAIDENSPPIIALAEKLLGSSGYIARSRPYQEVNDYYRAADVFTLASLSEGFGRVYIEALIHGLPCIVHDHPIMRYVLGDAGIFADLSKPSALFDKLREALDTAVLPELSIYRRESIRRRFDWPVLAPSYAAMFRAAALG